jgi:hypothetical protein
MPAPSESFVEALTDEEICPLCLDGYAPVDEVICALCEAPACPGCVEQLDDVAGPLLPTAQVQRLDGAAAAALTATGVVPAATRCFACRPALVPPPLPPQALARSLAARDALPPPLPLVHQARRPQPLPRPGWQDESTEPDEGGLVVFPAWRKAPLLALARAADAVHLDEVSSLLVGWAYTGGKRFALAARVSRVSREWSLALRACGVSLRQLATRLSGVHPRGADLRRLATRLSHMRSRGADLGRLATRLSLPLLSGLRVRGAAFSQALKVRTLVLAARTADLSRRLPQAARAAWPGARPQR